MRMNQKSKRLLKSRKTNQEPKMRKQVKQRLDFHHTEESEELKESVTEQKMNWEPKMRKQGNQR